MKPSTKPPTPPGELSETEDDGNALTKATLADVLFEQIGLNKRESKDLVDAFFDIMSEHLIAGDDVKMANFGNFQIRTKPPRPGRNPRTGESVPIQARRVVTFHVSPKLKERIQQIPERETMNL